MAKKPVTKNAKAKKPVPSKTVTSLAEKKRVQKEAGRKAAETKRRNKELLELPEETFKITDQVVMRRENAEIKALKRQVEEAVKDYEQLSDLYDIALALKTQNISKIKIPEVKPNNSIKNEATAIVQLSDTHFGKIILPSTAILSK